MPCHDRWETLRQLKFHKMQFCHYHIWIIIIIFFTQKKGRRRSASGNRAWPGSAADIPVRLGASLCGVTSAVSEGGPCEPSQFLFKNCLQREDKIENSFFPQMLYVTNYLLPNNENFIYSCICLLRQGLLCLYLSRTGITGMYHHRVL